MKATPMKTQYYLCRPRRWFNTFSASLRDINDGALKPFVVRGSTRNPVFSITGGSTEVLRFTTSRELTYKGSPAGVIENELKDKWLYFPEFLSIGDRTLSYLGKSGPGSKSHFTSSILLEGSPIGTIYYKNAINLFRMHFNAGIITEFEDRGHELYVLFFGTLFWWYRCFGAFENDDGV